MNICMTKSGVSEFYYYTAGRARLCGAGWMFDAHSAHARTGPERVSLFDVGSTVRSNDEGGHKSM